MKLRIASSTLLCLAALRAAGAQPTRNDSVSAPIRDVRYDVTFMRGDAEHRSVGVSMTFNTAGTAPVLLSLPAWTPGAYELSNFARWVTDFEAASESGKPLVWDKLDYDTWRVRPAGASVVTLPDGPPIRCHSLAPKPDVSGLAATCEVGCSRFRQS